MLGLGLGGAAGVVAAGAAGVVAAGVTGVELISRGVLTPVLLARDGEHAWLAICCAGQTDTSAGMLTEVFSTSDGGRTPG